MEYVMYGKGYGHITPIKPSLVVQLFPRVTTLN